MKNFKKITGIILSICLVITQFYVGGGKQAKAAEGTKTEITSSKLVFTYEKTGDEDAEYLKVCNAEVNDFKGNGTYEIDIAKSAWSTWDETGYYNLGFVESDTAYTLKNITLIANGKYEFILSETVDAGEKEGVYKVDFPNIWSGHKEGDILYTSKDGKATLVSGGNNVVISLYVKDDQQKPGEGDTEKPGEGDTEKPGEGDTEKPGEGDTEKPGEGDTEKPGEGDTEKPGEGDTEKPGEGDTEKPEKLKTEITSSKLVFTYEKTGDEDAEYLKVCNAEVNDFKGNGTYEIDIAKSAWSTWDETGYYNLGFVESDTAYTLKNITLIANGKYEFILSETVDAGEKEGVYKVDFPNIWSGYKEGDILYTSKDGKATLVSGGNNVVISLYVKDDQQKPGEGDTEKPGESDTEKPGEGDTEKPGEGDTEKPGEGDTEKPGEGDTEKPGEGDTEKPGESDTEKPEKVKTEITSSKLVFTYEKTGETEATYLKVCDTDVNDFKGNGTYETDIVKSAWNTWDETGYYNLGFVASDTAYTLKNVTLIVNGKYEFVLNETVDAGEKEGVYKVDFPNMWSGHKEGDILYTSKDGKATLVSGGNTAVISLCVEKTVMPSPSSKPQMPPYVIVQPPVSETPSGIEASGTAAPAATSNPTTTPTTEPAVPTLEPTLLPITEPVVNPTVSPTTIPETVSSASPEKPVSPSSKPETGNDVQKGDNVTVSGQKYEVTNISKNTVAYVAPKNSKKTAISVPATVKVTVNGKKVTYKVTSIKDKAFKGNKKIKTVTLSKNITSIGKDAFKNCGKLKTMVIKSTKIAKVGKDALKGTAKNLVIKVPAKKVSSYKKLFKNKGNKNIIIKKL